MRYRYEGWLLAAATGVVGVTFGILAQEAGLTVAKSQAMSAFVFTGASQFAAVTVIASGGSLAAAVASGLFLAIRNAFYGPVVAPLLPRHRLARAVSAQFVIDETTAMATAQEDPHDARGAFWFTALWLYTMWNVGTLVGYLAGERIADPQALGLDVAFPAAFIALLLPHLRTGQGRATAIAGGLVALVLLPVAPAGVPILAAALGIIPGYLIARRHTS